MDILSDEQYKGFWINTIHTDDGLEVKVGRNEDSIPLMTGLDATPVTIKYLGLSSWAGLSASYRGVKPGVILKLFLIIKIQSYS